MRSNDAYFGLPHDLFCFSMLQEMVAVKLGIGLGKYTHICSSLHIYEEKVERIESYLNEGLFEQLIMPPMGECNKEILQFVIDSFSNKKTDTTPNELPSYWHDYSLFSNKYFSSDQLDDWLSLFKTKELKLVAQNSVTE